MRAHAEADLAEHGDPRRATTSIFGSKPGTYGAGLLQLIDSRNWRDDADLAQVYTAWGGFAYGRGLDGAPAADDMNRQYRRIAVAAKNTDTREHDIADSDDYFQYHGGMVATVRALTGKAPAAYVGDTTRPDAVRTRTLSEETTRVFRARVVNPRWMTAMRRHGYKGAFEMAATVDYLFGYDATADVMADWMYEQLTAATFSTTRTASSWPSRTRGRCTAWPSGCSRRPTAACGPQPDQADDPRRLCGRCCSRRKATSRAEPVRLVCACHLCRRRQERIHPADHVHQGRPAQADRDLGGARRGRPGGDHPGEIVEGQAHPQHPAGDHRGMRPTRNPKGEAVEATAAILDKSANGATYDAIGKRYGLLGKTFNFFSKLRGGMENNVSIELKAVD